MCLLLSLGIASQASAAVYFFSYKFDLRTKITGSLSGDLNGDIINNISNVSVYVEGDPFLGNGYLSVYSFGNSGWTPGGAYLSISGLQNNFMFSNATLPSPFGWTNQFFSITGDASSNPVAPPEISYADHRKQYHGYLGLADFPPNSSWKVTDTLEPATVPEPSAWAMLIVGFSAIGIIVRRRSRQTSRLSAT